MKFKIIYGEAGTGKSTLCFNKISDLINRNENIVIITPEQYSYTAEKKLMECINSKAVLNAEVITFKRMAYRVLNEIGKANETQVTKCGKAMLLYCILDKQKNNLKFLGKSQDNIDLISNTINELKQHQISCNQVKDEISNIEDKYLKTKLQDIYLVYQGYENQIKDKYIDETDILTILAQNIDNTEIFNDVVFFIDEFSGFTSQEYEIIKKLIQIGKEVNITITSDSVFSSDNPESDIFYSNKQTIAKLYKIANELEIEIEEEKLEKNYRFKNNDLLFLHDNLYGKKFTKYEQNVENIKLFLAKNQYTEVENVAKEILKLVRVNGYDYKDISIISKNIETYSSLVKVIFPKYNIPVFIDEKRDLNQNIFIQYVLSILDVFVKNYSYEAVFNYIKSGFIDLDFDDIFKLENYCIKWGIKQNKWKKDFALFGDENKKQEIQRLNEIRKEIISPLVELKSKIDEAKTAENITRQIFEFIQEQNIEEKLKVKIKELEEEGLIDLANEYKVSYKVFINVLDEIIAVFKEDKVKIDKYIQILKIGLQNSGLGKIPGTQDQVILGDVDRSRSHKIKATFIIGLNDGVFPSVNKNEGFLNDSDRENLKNDNIELAKGTIERLYEDNYNIYKAFSTAEEKIYLSYISSALDGKAQRQSALIYKIKKIFPGLKEESDVVNAKYEVSSVKTTYEELLQNIARINEGKDTEEIWNYVYKYFANNEEWNNKLSKDLKALNYTNIPNDLDKNLLEKIHGPILKTSISKLEKYRNCPFSYYLQYDLKLKEKEELKVQNFETGSFMHEVIDEFFKRTKGEKKTLIDLLDNLEELQLIIDDIVENKLNDGKQYMFKATVKYNILVKRLKKIIGVALKYIIEGLVYSDFNIKGTEIEFDEGKTFKPILFNLDNGQKVELTGKIDRMDIGKDENGKYVRIIDYKSSAKNIDLNEVYAGIQLQLIAYLDAVTKDDLNPAGALYFGLLEQIIKTDKNKLDEEIENEIRKSFRMKGLILADINVIKMQDRKLESGSSKIIPAAITTSGEINKKNTNGIAKEEFEILQKYIRKIIEDISKEILSGKIDLKPYNKKGQTPCTYCSYKSICGFDKKNKDNDYNYIDYTSNVEVINNMKRTLEK